MVGIWAMPFGKKGRVNYCSFGGCLSVFVSSISSVTVGGRRYELGVVQAGVPGSRVVARKLAGFSAREGARRFHLQLTTIRWLTPRGSETRPRAALPYHHGSFHKIKPGVRAVGE